MYSVDSFSIGRSHLCSPETCKSLLSPAFHCLKVITQNIRSISKNFSEFEVLLSRMGFDSDILILTECWNIKTSNFPILINYNSYYSTVNFNQNDGVVVYVKNNLDHFIDEPHLSDASCLSIKLNHETIIFAVYRSPSKSNICSFINSLNNLLNSYKSFKNVILIGDININIDPDNPTNNSNDYLNMLAFHGILASHTYPTRDGNSLDHAMVRSIKPVIAMVLDAPITDHAAVLLCVDLRNKMYQPSMVAINKVNYVEIANKITCTDFSTILSSTDPSWTAEKLVGILSKYICSSMIKMVVPRRCRNIKPWITTGLIRSMRKRDLMHNKLKKHPDDRYLKSIYTNYKNVCNDLLKRLKRTHERTELMRHTKNPKKMWKTIKTIANMSSQKSSPDELLRVDSCPETSVNKVNNFFANVGKQLAIMIHKDCQSPASLSHSYDSPCSSMVMMPTDECEVESILMNLRNDCAVGWDAISAKILKSSKSVLVPILSHIFNLCITTGSFPSVFKIALIHPIHKAGDRNCINNYRPISVLTTLSKILEKLINKRLLSFLEKAHVLSSNQFGFRKGISSDDAVTALTDHVAKCLDSKQKCLGIFLDLAKAFDTVSIPILLRQMEKIGIRGQVLDVFRDYLSLRTQRVKIGDCLSSDEEVTFGVPQGSVLGPSLFLIYINGLCDMELINGSIFTYADDTALIFKGSNWEEARHYAERGLRTVMNWLNKNVLTLNISKTKFITFAINRKQLPESINFYIKAHVCTESQFHNNNCQCIVLERSSNIKYLGILLDGTLTWENQIHAISTRIRKLIYVFKTLRHVADFNLIKIIYFSLAQSILTYGITAWGGAAKTHVLELERAQRALLKVATFKEYRYSTEALYREWDVLSVRKLFIKTTILRQHKHLTFDFSKTLSRRGDKICQIPKYNTFFMHKFQCCLGPTLYNKINNSIKIYHQNYNTCKISVAKWLKSLTYNEVEDLFVILK